jgi:hypothetical protein
MKPTSHLRFVIRYVPDPTFGESIASAQRILQQWWAADPDCHEDFVLKVNGGWRDIPMEKEE